MSTSKRPANRKKKLAHFKLMKKHQMKKEQAVKFEELKQKIRDSIQVPDENVISSDDIGVEVDLDDIDSDLELVNVPEALVTNDVQISEDIPMVELPEEEK